MATVTHVIHSHYDPADREKLECETGQRIDEPSDDPWQTESSFSALRRLRSAPGFVPATITYDEWGVPSQPSSLAAVSAKPPEQQPSTSPAEWYRSLRLTASSSGVDAPGLAPPRPSSAPGSDSRDERQAPAQQLPPRERVAKKKDWFIRRALRSEPSTTPSSPAPSLADLLTRDPPPLPSEGRYIPPVWLHIGPSNRGFAMLERSGWKEGEGLGAHATRGGAGHAGEGPSSVMHNDPSDACTTPEVIDLTLSDSEASEDASGFEDDDVIRPPAQTQATNGEPSVSHSQRSLLTPLPTVLKADRLGIGLKAKTEGPYKRSKKRVTHNAAALAAHVRSAEEMRRKKAAFGRGKQGFAKIHVREEERRKAMLSYLNE